MFWTEKPGPEEGEILVYRVHVEQVHTVRGNDVGVVERRLKGVDGEPELDHVRLAPAAHEFGKEDKGGGVVENLAERGLVRQVGSDGFAAVLEEG